MLLENRFKTLDANFYCKQTTPSQHVVRGNNEWQDLWNIICPYDTKPPRVDFNKEMVLGVFLGQKPSAGYDIEISSLIEKDDCLEVYVKKTKPSPGSMCASVLTQPYHVISTEKVNKDIKYVFSG
jgi:hypothetical protein